MNGNQKHDDMTKADLISALYESVRERGQLLDRIQRMTPNVPTDDAEQERILWQLAAAEDEWCAIADESFMDVVRAEHGCAASDRVRHAGKDLCDSYSRCHECCLRPLATCCCDNQGGARFEAEEAIDTYWTDVVLTDKNEQPFYPEEELSEACRQEIAGEARRMIKAIRTVRYNMLRGKYGQG